MKKEEVRRKIKAHKTILDEKERLRAASSVFAMLEKTAAFLMSENILLYNSLPDELPTTQFLEKWSSRKNLYLPRVSGVNLEILRYEKSNMTHGAFGIEEPQGNELFPLSKIEMIIVPAIGYDPQGNRVGRGKGYYDRLLAETKAIKVGIGYDFQVVDSIETEPHDVKVDIIITDKSYYHIASRRKIRHI